MPAMHTHMETRPPLAVKLGANGSFAQTYLLSIGALTIVMKVNRRIHIIVDNTCGTLVACLLAWDLLFMMAIGADVQPCETSRRPFPV